MSDPVAIRPAESGDLALLEQYRRDCDPAAHATRLDEQQDGRMLYLLAWVDERPVGQVVMRWDGPDDPDLAARTAPLGRHVYIGALGVDAAYQSQGIGRRLLAAAESAAIRRGYRLAGLMVASDNVRAKALYERLGYQDTGLGNIPAVWRFTRRDGTIHQSVDVCVYLVKQLPATPDAVSESERVHP